MRVWLSYEEGCCWGEKKGGGLLYFRGWFEGRVKVACRLLYPIFKQGRGLLYFSSPTDNIDFLDFYAARAMRILI